MRRLNVFFFVLTLFSTKTLMVPETAVAAPPSSGTPGAASRGPTCGIHSDGKLRTVPKTIIRQLEQLRAILADIESPEEFARYVAEPKNGGADGRRDFFYLEDWGQWLRYHAVKDVRGNVYESVRRTFKSVEDRIGKYSERVERVEAARAYGLEPSFICYLTGKADLELLHLYQALVAEGWISADSHQIQDFEELISDLHWPKSKKIDHELSNKSARDIFDRYHTQMVEKMKPRLEEVNWQYDSHMEHGLHEVRRILRWMMIAMQMRPEAFSYSKKLDPNTLTLANAPFAETEEAELALDIAKKSLTDALARRTPMIAFEINKPGTIIVDPEMVFYVSGLVDILGNLKRKSELYFNLQKEYALYQIHGLFLSPSPAEDQPDSSPKGFAEIQLMLVQGSSRADQAINLVHVFSPGDEDAFRLVRFKTLRLLEPFWILQPIKHFKRAAHRAYHFWQNDDCGKALEF